MRGIGKTLTNDEKYLEIVNLYGSDFVNENYMIFDRVINFIDIPDYDIDNVQKIQLFRNAIKRYIAINKNAAFRDWNIVKSMFKFIGVEDLPEMKMIQEPNISLNEILIKYGIDGLINSGIDIDCLFRGKKILNIEELNNIKGIDIEDLKKFVYSNDRKILDICTPKELLEYGINNFIDLVQLSNLYLIRDMMKVIPLKLIKMGSNTELKREFIEKYGMDNIIKLDEETGGIFSHKYDDNSIYLNIIVMIDKIKNSNIKSGCSYEEFRDGMYNVLLNVRNEDIQKKFGNKINYDFIQGKFREDYQDIFIDGVSDEIKNAFYTGKINAGMIKSNPELIDVLKSKRLFLAWDKKPNFVKNDIENVYDIRNYNYIVFLKNLIDSLGKEKFLNICHEYGNYLGSLGLPNSNVLYENDIREIIDDEIYNNIVNNGMDYSDDLPLSFKKKHCELFFDDLINEELRKKFYSGSLSFKDIKENPDFANVICNKDFFVGFKRLRKEMKHFNREFLWTKLSVEEILFLAKKYGDSLIEVKDSVIFDYLRDGNLRIIEAEIENNILNRDSKYDENVPEFFKAKYPKMFLSEGVPEDLRKIFYDSDDVFNFDVIRENLNWMQYLENIDLRRAFPESYNIFFKNISNKRLMELERNHPGIMARVVEENLQRNLIEWYKATGGRFLPNYVVIKLFPIEEIDNFLINSKKWSKLVRDSRVKSDVQLESLLKFAYVMGVFHGKDEGFTKLIKLFGEIPKKISKENFDLISDYIKQNDVDQINILNSVYVLKDSNEYVFNANLQNDKNKILQLRRIMNDMNFPGLITPVVIEKMFERLKMQYNIPFANFLIKNINKIVCNEEYIKAVPLIQKQFNKIIDVDIGRVKEITLHRAICHIKDIEYNNIDIGNDDVADEAQCFEYGQDEFDLMQKIYNEGEFRDYSSIPRILGEEDGMKYEMLRCDDPLALTIGDRTDCCQKIGGKGFTAMEHSMVSPDGRVFCVRDKFDRIIAQSWVWRNQNVICFDDIEISDKVYSLYISENPGTSKIDLANRVLMVYKRAAKELMDVDKLIYSKMLEQKKITQEEYDCLLLKKVTTGLGYREIAEVIKVDGTLYCDDDMVKVIHSDRFRELYTDANIQYIINSEGYIRNKQNNRIQNLYIYEDDIPIYDKNNLNMKVLLKLQRMKNVNDLIDSNYDDKSDMFDSEKMIMDIASKYEFNPENTKIVSTARIGMIYSEDDKCVEIGDLVTAPIKDNLTFEEKKKMSKHIVNQIKKSLMQIDIGNRKVDLSKLDESQRGLLINLINQVRNRHYDCDYIMN